MNHRQPLFTWICKSLWQISTQLWASTNGEDMHKKSIWETRKEHAKFIPKPEPEIKLPTSVGSLKKHKSSRKNICFTDYAKTFDCVDHNKRWKILKEIGIPDHLTCLLRNMYAGQEATVRTGYGTTDQFQIRKGVHQGCILFNF